MLKNKVLGNIGLLVGGTAIAQAITFVGMLYLTKIYTPESFGIVSLCTSLISLLVPLATMRYDKAIILAKDEIETKRLLLICFALGGAFFIFLSAIGFIVYSLNILSNKWHNVLLVLVPVGVFLFGLMNAFQMYFEKQSKFKVTSSVAVLEASSKLGLQYSLSNILPMLGMLFGYILSLVFNVCFYVIKAKKIFSRSFFCQKKNDLIFLCKKHIKFPKYFTWSNIIDSASQNICALTFPFLFSLSILGNFSLAYKIVRLPAFLFSMATRRVYYPKASELFFYNREKFKTLYKKGTFTLFVISIIPVIVFQFFAEDLFELFFDSRWIESAAYAKIIVWYVFFNFCNSLAHENMIIFGLQKRFLIIESVWFTLSFLLIFIAYTLKSPEFAIIFYALSGIVMEIMIFLSNFHAIRRA
ncbi:oligosaccharide flippase family protein [Aestuariivivens marinum]|uniref:oligosaccharide flippase family protein n=1 Tax=Aestuariivivens marinum TaxID=2913555 RepID=UPI001F55CC43|nr:oligosaccharide flippase family protein [Aestuariivivens marinum]